MSELQNKREYDVVFSFAGAQRDYVEMVKNELSKYDVSVFYDNDNVVDLWGKNLYPYLAEIYSEKANYCVIFISKEYKERPWTIHEFQFASQRVFDNYGKQDVHEYLLPVIFDDTTIPGLLRSIGHMDAREESPEKLAEYIAIKIGKYNLCSNVEQSVDSLFKHLKSNLYDNAMGNDSFQILEENNTINVSFYTSDYSKNIITLQFIEKYIYFYFGEFILGLNPSAIVFIDNKCKSSPIKLINFSTFFRQFSEQNLNLKELDSFLIHVLTALSEVE